MLRAALAVLALAAPMMVLLAGYAWTDRPPLVFATATMGGPRGSMRAVRLPFHDEGQEQATYRYDVILTAAGSWRSGLRIVPDDCARSLVVNGEKVALDGIDPLKLCDYRGGFVVDVGRLLHQGNNRVEVEVENMGGPYGLTIHSVRGSEASGWRALVILLALVAACAGACFAAGRRLRMAPASRWVAAVLLALAGWLRFRYVFDWHAPECFLFSDMENYADMAREYVRGVTSTYQTFQPSGYPLLLALSLRLRGDFVLLYWAHVLAGWGTVALMWRASARWLGERAGLWVLGIAAVHVAFIVLSGFALAETIFTFQLALLFYCLARFAFPWKPSHALLIGLVFMSMLWVKGNATLFGPLVIAWMAFWVLSRPRAEWRRRARRVALPAAAFCAGAALVVASHAAYTHARYGHARLSAGTAALNLVEGKCPAKYNVDSNGKHWISPLFVQIGEMQEKRWNRPFTDDRYFWSQGLACIREDPWVVAKSARYVYYLFFGNKLWPPNLTDDSTFMRWSAVLTSALLVPTLGMGIVIVGRRPRRKAMLYVLLGASIILCAWVFKSELRYRVPFDVVFIPIGVLGASWVVARIRALRPVVRRLLKTANAE